MWLAGCLAGWVGGSLAWVGVAVTLRKLFPFGGEMQGTLAGDSDRSQISLSEKVPDYPPCNFTVIGEGVEKEKIAGGGGRGGLGGETEREKKWRMKRGRMETHRERRDGSRGGR